MAKEYFIIRMDQSMKVNGMTMYEMVTEFIHIQIMIPMRVNGEIIKEKDEELIHMQQQVCLESYNLLWCCFKNKTWIFIEAQYTGIWNNGKRQGPGEMQFSNYNYVGKFHENYVCYFSK